MGSWTLANGPSDHPGLTEAAPSGAAAENLNVETIVHDVGQRHEALLGIGPVAQVKNRPLLHHARYRRVKGGEFNEFAISIDRFVERRHVDPVDGGENSAQSVTRAREISLPYIEAGSFTYDAGYKIGANLAEVGRIPDALVVAADEIAFGVIDGLRRHGVSVPGDVRVTGFDGVPQSAWEGYGLTTLVQPIEQMVASVLQLLSLSAVDQIVTIEGELRIANTTRGETSHG
ncbi:MAG: hypothetical protein EBV42_06950 [Actinobacteria bacterium]|nr:hypothetical protein [Actinomycetota bacterium]